MIDRRTLLASGAALAATPAFAKVAGKAPAPFPQGFLWGTATAGHQVEGNNVNSDFWLLEHITPTLFGEPSGQACDSFHRWRDDLALVKKIGLNSYRFSIEWSRIEPLQGVFSAEMLDHYKRIVHTCRDLGIAPIVTFSHWSVPIWFASLGGWTNPDASELFARYCDRAARHLAAEMAYAVTLNEPNGLSIADRMIPEGAKRGLEAMLVAARQATGAPKFVGGPSFQYAPAMQPSLLKGHRMAFDAIKAANSALPVGFSLAIVDEQADAQGAAQRDRARAEFYGPWLDTAGKDDFLGIQNYTRRVWGADGPLPAPAEATLDQMGGEIVPDTLANCVRYAHAQTGKPIIVTEHGFAVSDDRIRAAATLAALAHLRIAIADGVPVLGYQHWSLLDNFEWTSGYRVTYGLASVDRKTFRRTAKPSAKVYGAVARTNRL